MKSNTQREDHNNLRAMPALSLSSIAVRASILSLGLVSGASQAATIEVTSNADDNGADCTLRQAIVSINTLGLQGGCINTGDVLGMNDSITFASSLSPLNTTIELTNGYLLIEATRSITIDASAIINGMTVDANQQSAAFYAQPSATLTIDNMVISNGSNYGGGGIELFKSNLSLNNTTVTGNFSEIGAAISGFESSISLNNSTVSGNSTAGGGAGGIYARAVSNIFLVNSTVSGNSTNGAGGGITVIENSNVSLSNSTVSDNTLGGIRLQDSSLLLSNSIIANSFGGDDCNFSSSVITSDSASIIEDGSCAVIGRTGDPGLLPLADNGGPTQTHALQPNSIANNTGILFGASLPFVNCTTSDQRGVDRNDGKCDVGAFEYIDLGSFYVIPLGNNKVVVIPL